MNNLPNTMTVGGRAYEIISLIKSEEHHYSELLDTAEEMNADLGEEDCKHILEYQKDIPHGLRGKITFVFTGWSCPDKRLDIACIVWEEKYKCWCLNWIYLGNYWFKDDCGLRRV